MACLYARHAGWGMNRHQRLEHLTFLIGKDRRHRTGHLQGSAHTLGCSAPLPHESRRACSAFAGAHRSPTELTALQDKVAQCRESEIGVKAIKSEHNTALSPAPSITYHSVRGEAVRPRSKKAPVVAFQTASCMIPTGTDSMA
ncbi:hypothetical protein NDU88_006322 [Pleurodeles waltl]|uniref:Uncharacterized protein n=1 Tax=Pleurodeles waltl TaxID=8319 RepID=A0AAV7L506_PLEWA|nr:hypothetical protein NDU88_006322 [Pleurodeles waltl]